MHVAIVGTGVSGLVAASRLHRSHDVTLFEAGAHVGGHACTVDVDTADGPIPADVGFMVFNETTYPRLSALFRDLGVAARDSDMSFSVRCEAAGIEWCGTDLRTVFAWKRNLLRPSFVRMLLDVVRFNREAAADLDEGLTARTLGAYLADRRYSDAFRDLYLVPMGAAIWSSPAASMLEFPAEFFVRFFRNHGLLTIDRQPAWRTVVGGSRRYVEAIARPFADRIRVRCPVRGVRRVAGGVLVETDDGTERFDHVVLACHSDQALAMLRDPSDAEREVLGAIPYHRNDAVLHADERVLPRRARARASWNYRRDGAVTAGVSVTYDLARLQGLPTRTPVLLTLNPTPGSVAEDRVVRRFAFEHPAFTPAGERAKERHGEIDGIRRTSYCGAYWRNGFHEDGVWSAERATADLIGARVREIA